MPSTKPTRLSSPASSTTLRDFLAHVGSWLLERLSQWAARASDRLATPPLSGKYVRYPYLLRFPDYTCGVYWLWPPDAHAYRDAGEAEIHLLVIQSLPDIDLSPGL
ncbi:hypothetical protein [Candidatus Solirubrobacter pratensis]|uniref:hypothetical protein n=1 Tax=Candidatus Solirubrobacter pratensis TaxID=1298857 RepID=UPI0004883627|nr:hypothetical protein [Candidatus Solirubrobacter pratensis]